MYFLFEAGDSAQNALELQQACGPKETRGRLCEITYSATSSQNLAEIADALSKPLRVLAIIVLAYLTNRLVRFFIRRSVTNLAK